MTDRELIVKWWNDAWNEGLWAAAWSKSIELSPQEAAWHPSSAPGVSSGRHSIWQIVLHMIFWRESWLRRAATGQKPTKEEIAAGNFPPLTDTTQAAWDAARQHFADTQTRMAAVLADPKTDISILVYFVPHDSYHFGQINYLRAMQGLKPIE
jgi:uncharacterized damage-inducible protein DinB